MDLKIKTCPFCGQTPKAGCSKSVREDLDGKQYDHYQYYCISCETDECVQPMVAGEDLGKIINKWNKRV